MHHIYSHSSDIYMYSMQVTQCAINIDVYLINNKHVQLIKRVFFIQYASYFLCKKSYFYIWQINKTSLK